MLRILNGFVDSMHQFPQCFMYNCMFEIVVAVGIIIMASHMKRFSAIHLLKSQRFTGRHLIS